MYYFLSDFEILRTRKLKNGKSFKICYLRL